MGLKNVAKHVRKIKHKKVEWRKGESGTSNPTTTKHRLAAKRSKKSTELTVESLRKFNEKSQSAQQAANGEAAMCMDDGERHSTVSSIKESVISWATCASDISVRSFRGIFEKFEESGKHREAVAMIAACSEVLRSRGLALNETGYFAVLLSNVNAMGNKAEKKCTSDATNQQESTEDDVTREVVSSQSMKEEDQSLDSLRTALFLLRVIMKRINREVLKARFVRYAAALRNAFAAAKRSKNGATFELDSNVLLEWIAVVRNLLAAQSVRCFADAEKRDAASWFIDRLCMLLSNAMLRKSAASALVSILRTDVSVNVESFHPFASRIVEFCVSKLRAIAVAGENAGSDADREADAQTIVAFASRCGDVLPAASFRRLAEALLSVAKRDPRRFSAPVCHSFARLFASGPRADCISAELTAKLLNALHDVATSQSRFSALRFGLANLARLTLVELRAAEATQPENESFRLLAAHIERAFETGLSEVVSSGRSKSHDAAFELCRSIFVRIADLITINLHENITNRLEAVCCEVLARLNSAITLQNVASWRVLFSLISDNLRNLLPDEQNTVVTNMEHRASFRETLVETIRRLAALRENAVIAVRDGGDESETVNAIDECLAEALRRCDLQGTIWPAVRIEVRFAPRFTVINDWLVALVSAHARHWSLAFWHSDLLPLAAQCEAKLPNCSESDVPGMRTLVEQVWLLLSCACTTAQDVDSLRLFGKLIADKVREATESLVIAESRRTATHQQRITLGLSALAALRKLIGATVRRLSSTSPSTSAALQAQAQAQSDILARYAKNYLPLLFNLVTTEPPADVSDYGLSTPTTTVPILTGLQLAALETVRLYAALVPSLLGEFFDKAILKLDESTARDAFRRHALLDLLIALCAHVDEVRASQIVTRALTVLQNVTDTSEAASTSTSESRLHKKYYRILETVCERTNFVSSEQHVAVLRTFVLANLRGAAPGIVKPRLRLLNKLIKVENESAVTANASESFIDACFPEVVLCLSSSSRSVRQLAQAVILNILSRFNATVGVCQLNGAMRELLRRLFALLAAANGSEALQVAVIRAISIGLEQSTSEPEFSDDAEWHSLIVSIFDTLCALIAVAKKAPVVRAALDLADGVVKRASDWPSVMLVFETCVLRLLLHVPSAFQHNVRFAVKRVFERAMRKAHDVHVVERALRRLNPAKLADYERVLRNCRKRIERAWRKRAATENESDSDSGSEDESESDFASKSKSKIKSKKSAVSAKSSKSRRSVVKSVATILDEAVGRGDKKSREVDDDYESRMSDDSEDRIVEHGDEIVDLLDPEAVSNVRTASIKRRRPILSADNEKDEGFAMAPDGRIILTEERDSDRGRDNRSRKTKRNADEDDGDDDSLDQADVLSGVQLKSLKSAKTRASKISSSSNKNAKDASASKGKGRKTDGKSDARRRGEKFEPFAYVQLDRRALNKRKQAKMTGRFEKLVKSAKRGAASGSKANATAVRKLKRIGRADTREQSGREMDFD